MVGDDSDELPDELDLGDDIEEPALLDVAEPIAMGGAEDSVDLPMELPLSDSEPPELEPAEPALPAAPLALLADRAGIRPLLFPSQQQQQPDAAPAGNAFAALAARGQGMRGRRGRGRPPTSIRRQLQGAHLAQASESQPSALGMRPAATTLALRGTPSNEAASVGDLKRRARIDVAMMESRAFCEPAADGYGFRTGLESAVSAVGRLASLQGVQPNSDVERISHHYVDAEVMHIASLANVSEQLGTDPWVTKSTVRRMAAMHALKHRNCWMELVERIVGSVPRESLLLHLEFSSYDETPLPVMLRTRIVRRAPRTVENLLAIEGAPNASTALAIGRHRGLSVQLREGQAKQKVVQTQGEYGILLKFVQTDRIGYAMLRFVPAFPLAVLQECTGKSLQLLAERLTLTPAAARAFLHTTRAVTTDGASTCILAEKLLASQRSWADEMLHMLCDVHRTSRVYDGTFQGPEIDSGITGSIRAALSLRTGGAFSKFKSCLSEEIRSRLVILRGRPPRAAEEYKKFILRMFCKNGPAALKRSLIMALVPNGEWRSDRIEFYIDYGPHGLTDPGDVPDYLVAGLMLVFASSQPATYPRHRWTGMDLAVDELGLMESCHRLLSTTFMRFAASFYTGARRAQLLAAGASMSSYEGNKLAEVEDVGGAGAVEHDGPEHDPGAADPAAEHKPAEKSESDSWAAENTANRGKAVKWLASELPLVFLMSTRIIMEPLRVLMTKQFEEAGAQWDLKQQVKMVKALKAGLGPNPFASRDYRVAIAASGAHDRAFYTAMNQMLEHPDLWNFFPQSSHKVSFRAQLFRTIARMGCAYRMKAKAPHDRFPTQIFRLLQEPDFAAVYESMPECLLDQYTKALRKRYPTGKEQDLLMVLFTIACILWKDTARIESMHASIRRCLTILSTQAQQMDIQDLSAHFLLQRLRTNHGKKVRGRKTKRRKVATRKVGNVARGKGLNGEVQKGILASMRRLEGMGQNA